MREFSWLLGLVAVAALGWLLWRLVDMAHVPTLDWIIGLVMFLWLLVIVTVPWNVHFQARELIAEARASRKRGIAVEDANIEYAERWMQRSLLIAIGLHVITAFGMAWLSLAGITALGNWGAAAAAGLTFARPIMRGYEYVRRRLAGIRQVILNPREDVVELRGRVDTLVQRIDDVERQLDTNREDSIAARHTQALERHGQELESLRIALQEHKEANTIAHDRLSREAQNAMAQVMGDAAILNHVREIVRFFKQT
jgi:hypothetical protein